MTAELNILFLYQILFLLSDNKNLFILSDSIYFIYVAIQNIAQGDNELAVLITMAEILPLAIYLHRKHIQFYSIYCCTNKYIHSSHLSSTFYCCYEKTFFASTMPPLPGAGGNSPTVSLRVV